MSYSRGLRIKRIRTSLEARIAPEQGKHVERTAGYSNDDDPLRREFGIGVEPEVSESTEASPTDLGRPDGLREPQRNQGVDQG